MKLARWGSSVVLRYVGGSPLAALTSTYIRQHAELASRLRTASTLCDVPPIAADPSVLIDCDELEEPEVIYLQHRSTKRIHIALASELEFLC